MRTFKHWTPRYVFDRLRVFADQKIHPGAPWLTRRTIEFLESWLRPSDYGWEWGSGRSTVWFAKRVRALTSVEHNREWYERVASSIRSQQITNADYRLIESEADYASPIDSLPRQSLDFTLVDGIVRDACALAAIPKIRPGGILIVDNVEWFIPSSSRAPGVRRLQDGWYSSLWQQVSSALTDWRVIWTSNGVWDTAIWIKPGCADASGTPRTVT